MLQITESFAMEHDGYKNGVCEFNAVKIGDIWVTGLAAKIQFPELDWSDSNEVEILE